MSTTEMDERTPGERLDQRQKLVLHQLMLDPFPWAVQELVRELGKEAGDAIAELAGAGLVHRMGDFVIPSRSARRAYELHEGAS